MELKDVLIMFTRLIKLECYNVRGWRILFRPKRLLVTQASY